MTRPTDDEIAELLLEMSRRLQRASSAMRSYALNDLHMMAMHGLIDDQGEIPEGIAQDITRADLAPELCRQAKEMAEQLSKKREFTLYQFTQNKN
jgi:hypothetical protein